MDRFAKVKPLDRAKTNLELERLAKTRNWIELHFALWIDRTKSIQLPDSTKVFENLGKPRAKIKLSWFQPPFQLHLEKNYHTF